MALALPSPRDTRRRFEVWGQWLPELKLWKASTILVMASGAHYHFSIWGSHTSVLHAVALAAVQRCAPGCRPATHAEIVSEGVFVMKAVPDLTYIHFA